MESLKILVLGDVGVGKSSFLKLITERYSEIYPINFFDYYVHIDEEEKNKKFISAKDLAENNCKNQNVQALVESMFFQAKRNFLEFIESKMRGENFFFEERHKYTYGFEVFTFLWHRNNEYNNNKFEKYIPLNIRKTGEYLPDVVTMHRSNGNTENTDYHNDALLVEFLEIGGIQTYSCTRNIFYEKHDGILLVYDSSNNKSYHNLVKWLYELYEHTNPPSDVFCSAKRGRNKFWNFFNSHETNKKLLVEEPRVGIKKNYYDLRDHVGNYPNFEKKNKKKKKNNNPNCALGGEYYTNGCVNLHCEKYSNGYVDWCENDRDDDPFGSEDNSDSNSDIEKGHVKKRGTKKGDKILKGEIPVALLATKIDKKNAKEKPAFVKTPENSIFYRFFFPDFSGNANESAYGSKNNLKKKKEILKKLENHISQATEIKASSIDCVVDIEKFIYFLRLVYDKKYNTHHG
ncbi:ras GTPAse [Plasmodium gonderi]|uniref:Ras GTPAse n=1 Tax=Plasmodium gonderi TaxID=77519 RepID=A0A1Y1JH56_PLAGO|nr:ras GTPAse [Plasmodium gonderi]GAW81856.1 ras GTPAse [Plasmodium gonderi]